MAKKQRAVRRTNKMLQFERFEDEEFGVVLNPVLVYGLMGYDSICYKQGFLTDIILPAQVFLKAPMKALCKLEGSFTLGKDDSDYMEHVNDIIATQAWNLYYVGKFLGLDWNNDLRNFIWAMRMGTELTLGLENIKNNYPGVDLKEYGQLERPVNLTTVLELVGSGMSRYPEGLGTIVQGILKMINHREQGLLTEGYVRYFSNVTGYSIEDSLKIFDCFSVETYSKDPVDLEIIDDSPIDLITTFYRKVFEGAFYANLNLMRFETRMDKNKLKIDSLVKDQQELRKLERRFKKLERDYQKVNSNKEELLNPYKEELEKLKCNLQETTQGNHFLTVELTGLRTLNKRLKEQLDEARGGLRDSNNINKGLGNEYELEKQVERLESEVERLRKLMLNQETNLNYTNSFNDMLKCKDLTVTVVGGIKNIQFYERLFKKVYLYDGEALDLSIAPSTDLVLIMTCHVSHAMTSLVEKLVGDKPVISINGYNEDYIISEISKNYKTV